jgi:hypothetical protein
MQRTQHSKSAGRPKVCDSKRAIKPNISVRRDLLSEATEAAKRKGVGLSEYVTEALRKQIALDAGLI